MATFFGPGSLTVPMTKKRTDTTEGVAPPGWEQTVQDMKQTQGIDNPFAVAWWMKNRGAHPARHVTDMASSAQSTHILKQILRQQKHIPSVCLAAARGEGWAQAQLLAADCPPLLVEGRW